MGDLTPGARKMSENDDFLLILGVPEMDRDHQAIDALFSAVAATGDAELPSLLDRISRELEAHFAREEQLMADGHAPLVECHKAQHRMLLREVAEMTKVAPVAPAKDLRRLMQFVLPQVVAAHVASVDRVAAAYLTGDIEDRDLAALRLQTAAAKV